MSGSLSKAARGKAYPNAETRMAGSNNRHRTKLQTLRSGLWKKSAAQENTVKKLSGKNVIAEQLFSSKGPF